MLACVHVGLFDRAVHVVLDERLLPSLAEEHGACVAALRALEHVIVALAVRGSDRVQVQLAGLLRFTLHNFEHVLSTIWSILEASRIVALYPLPVTSACCG